MEKLSTPYLTAEAQLINHLPCIKLSWTIPTTSDPIIYHLFRSKTPNFEANFTNQIALNETIVETSWLDTNVEKNSTYYYRVRGINILTNESSLFPTK